jgi:hypothetical protein
VRSQEEDARRRVAYDRAKVERDKLAAEFAKVYPGVVQQLADIVARMAENDAEIERINAHAMPSGADRLLVSPGASAHCRARCASPSSFGFRPSSTPTMGRTSGRAATCIGCGVKNTFRRSVRRPSGSARFRAITVQAQRSVSSYG